MSEPTREFDHWTDPGAPSGVSLRVTLLVLVVALVTILAAYEVITRAPAPTSGTGGAPAVPVRAGP